MKDALLYGASWCPFCRAVKNWLDTKGIKYSYKDVDEAPCVRVEME
jgi:glutaredoxin